MMGPREQVLMQLQSITIKKQENLTQPEITNERLEKMVSTHRSF